MKKYSEVFIAFDTAKKKHAVAIADGGHDGEIRYFGEIDSAPPTVERVIGKLAARYTRLHLCYEAGPTGYGLYRQVKALGHDCTVVAPSLIPRKPGERVKTNRRDAVTLARLFRAGELTSVWVPDAVHEAVRDLVRAREAAAQDPSQEASAAAVVSAASWPHLQRSHTLEPSPPALAGRAEVRAPGAADRLPGCDRCDRRCRRPPATSR
jgi:transposase